MSSLLLLLLKFVGAKDTDTVLSLGFGETALTALKQLENLLHDDMLDIDLFFVVQVRRGELNLSYVR